jgi:hypothetical protein
MYFNSASFANNAAAIDIGGDGDFEELDASAEQLTRRGKM